MTRGGADGRLRVLMLARSYPNNVLPTLGLWTARPARHLNELCDVRVISPVPYCPPGPRRPPFAQYTRFRDVDREEVRDGIRVYHPRYLVGPSDALSRFEATSYYRSIRALVDRIHGEFPFDVIHGHFVFPDGVVAHRLSRRYRVPFVITDQAPWRPWLEAPHVRRQALPAAREAAALTCVSRYLRETILHYLPGADVRVIPNGVDGSQFTLGRPDTRKRNQIVFVGIVNRQKGFDVLLEALEKLSPRLPDSRLLVIGSSFYRYTRLEEERLRRRAEPLVREGRVEFLGRCAPQEVARHVSESAVLALPSRGETFGAVLVEALAAGTPVVSTYSGGPEDIVTDEVGTLVPIGDAAALADALHDLLSEPMRFQPSHLRDYALENFSWSSVARAFHDLYLEVGSEPGQRQIESGHALPAPAV